MQCDHFVSSENLLNQNVSVCQKSVIDLVEVKCRVKISKLTKPILHQMKTCQNAAMWTAQGCCRGREENFLKVPRGLLVKNMRCIVCSAIPNKPASAAFYTLHSR